jgi:regulator of nucleoside diphosphate kinase
MALVSGEQRNGHGGRLSLSLSQEFSEAIPFTTVIPSPVLLGEDWSFAAQQGISFFNPLIKECDAMEQRDIYMTAFDLERLSELLQVGIVFNGKNSEYLQSLERELDRAHVVDPKAIPKDVVTMNSQVCLRDLDTDEERTYTLVFPSQAKIEEGRISVLAPIGTAMLGYRVGDTIEWQVPAGVKKVKIEEVLYQPEAAGDYDR